MLADDFMLRDGYPRLYSSEMPLELFFSSYLSTYVERDVAGYLNVRNVDRFPQIPASLRSERRFVAARVESSFQAKDEQVYSAADWLTR